MADNTIRGLNVTLTADGAEVSKTLKQLNSELKSSAKLSKELDKSLKYDPKNLDLLEAKLNNVEDALQASTQRTTLLYNELEDLKKTDAGVDKIKKLEAEILRSENSTQALANEFERLNSDIKAIQTEKFDELSKKTKSNISNLEKMSKSTEKLVEETSGLDFGEFSSLGSQLPGIDSRLSSIAGAVNPVTLGIGALAGAFGFLYSETKTNQQIQREFATTTLETNLSIKEQGELTRILSKRLNLDLGEGLQIAKDSMKIYGDEIRNAKDFTQAFTDTLILQENGLLGVEEAQSSVQQAQTLWNISADKANNLLFNYIGLIEKYGQRADDVIDTQREFGDTFKLLGANSDDFFRILETGLLSGARNTDEVANAFNEFYLRVSEGSEETRNSFQNLGLSFEDVSSAMLSGDFSQVEQAFYQIIVALSQLNDDSESFITNSQKIFGTYGEEFVGTIAGNKEVVNALNDVYLKTTSSQELVASAATKLKNELDDLYKSGEINVQEYNNMNDELKELDITTLITTEDTELLASSLVDLQKKGKITAETNRDLQIANSLLSDSFLVNTEELKAQINALDGLNPETEYYKSLVDNLAESYGVSNEQMKFLIETGGDLTGVYKTLNEEGVLNDEQIKNITASQELYNSVLENSVVVQGDYGLNLEGTNNLLGIFNDLNLDLDGTFKSLLETEQGYIEVNKVVTDQLGQVSIVTESVDANSLSLSETIAKLGEQGVISKESISELSNSLKVYRDSNSTTEQRVEALRNVMSALRDENIITEDQFINMSSSVNALADVLSGERGLTGAIQDASEAESTSSENIDRMRNSIEDTIGPIEKWQAELEKAKIKIGNLGVDADKAEKKIRDITSAIDEYNSKPIRAKTFTQTTVNDVVNSGSRNAVGSNSNVNRSLISSSLGVRSVPQQRLATDVSNFVSGNSELSKQDVTINLTAQTTNPRALAEAIADEIVVVMNERK